MSLPAVLLVVFVVLKLCHVVAWSWWWVTAPAWLVLLSAVWVAVHTVRREAEFEAKYPDAYARFKSRRKS